MESTLKPKPPSRITLDDFLPEQEQERRRTWGYICVQGSYTKQVYWINTVTYGSSIVATNQVDIPPPLESGPLPLSRCVRSYCCHIHPDYRPNSDMRALAELNALSLYLMIKADEPAFLKTAH